MIIYTVMKCRQQTTLMSWMIESEIIEGGAMVKRSKAM